MTSKTVRAPPSPTAGALGKMSSRAAYGLQYSPPHSDLKADFGAGRPQSRPAAQLSGLGVSKTQSSRWQKLGGMEDEAFDPRARRQRARAALLRRRRRRKSGEARPNVAQQDSRATCGQTRAPHRLCREGALCCIVRSWRLTVGTRATSVAASGLKAEYAAEFNPPRLQIPPRLPVTIPATKFHSDRADSAGSEMFHHFNFHETSR
jgi:hypothetical protein